MRRVWRAAPRLVRALGPIAPALVTGLALRYALAPFTSWPHDDVTWFQAATSGQHQLGLFARSQFPYPPLWGLLLQALGQVIAPLSITGSALGTSDAHFALLDQATNAYSSVITGPLFNLAFKTMLFAFDIGTGLLIRDAVRTWTSSSRKGNLAFTIWFLSPFPLFESAIFGGFDTMVGFTIMATLVLLLRRRYLWAGVAIGLGAFVKVSPILLLPMAGLLAADVTIARRRLRLNVRAPAALAAGMALPIAIIGLPLLVTGAFGAATHATSARTLVGLDVGGFSLFGIRSFAVLSGIGTWASDHAGLVTGATTLAAAAVSVVIGWLAMVAARRNRVWAILGGGTAVFAIVLLTQPLTQPQYLLWLLPEAITIAVATGVARWQLVVLSITPVVYVYSLLGPAAVLGPLATTTGWVSPQWVADRSVEWYNAPAALWGDSLGGDFRAPAALATIVALISLLALVLRRMRAAGGGQEPVPAPAHRSANVAVALVGTLLLGTVGATVFAYRLPPLGRNQAALGAVSATPTATGTRLQLSVHPGPGQSTVRVIAFPIARYSPACSLDVVVDPAYPGPDSTPRAIQGIFDHVTAELRLRGDQRPINEIDVPSLVKVLNDTSTASGTCVVMSAGVMPADVFSRRVDRTHPLAARRRHAHLERGGDRVLQRGSDGEVPAGHAHQLS